MSLLCNPTTPLNFTVLIPLHCTTTSPLHYTQYTGPPLLHCTILSTLDHHYSTALHSVHCTTNTPLHYTQYTEPPLLHCTILSTLDHHYSTALYSLNCTTTTPRHYTQYTLPPLLHCTLLHFNPTTIPEFHCTAPPTTPLNSTDYTTPLHSSALYSLLFSPQKNKSNKKMVHK